MKKAVSFLMAVVMVLSLCSCKLIPTPSSSVETVEEYEEFEYYEGKKKDKNKNKNSKPDSTSSQEDTDEGGQDNGSSDDTSADSSSSSGKNSTVNSSSNSSSGGNSNNSSFNIEDEPPLDLNGKTVTLAITEEAPYNIRSFQVMVNAFEQKYKCNVKTYNLKFSGLNAQVKQRKSTGDPYDIIYVHGSNFPEGAQIGIYADLTQYLYREDTSNFDMDKTNTFKWGIRTYGICTTYSAYPYIFYYNKALFDKSGLEDPRTLYNQGQWTWDKIFSMGKTATNSASNIYFLSSNINHTNFYGVSSVTIDNGKVHLNLHDEKTILSLKLIQKIYCETGIGKQIQSGDSRSEFIAGQNYMFVDDSSKYPEIWSLVKNSASFDNNISNLKIVPIPLPAENYHQAYPTGWHNAICSGAGEGSDPRIAIAWAQFVATYKVIARGQNEMPAADQELMDSIMRGTTVPNRQGVFKTGSTTTLTLYDRMAKEIRQGGNIDTIVDSYYGAYCNAIRDTLGSNEFIKN